MIRSNSQGALTHQIASSADDQGLGGVKGRDTTTVLLLLGVAESDGGSNLGLYGSRELLDGAVDQGRALRVSRHKDLGVGAFGSSSGDLGSEGLGLSSRGTTRGEVAEKAGRVRDALSGDIGLAEGGLDAVNELRAGVLALYVRKGNG